MKRRLITLLAVICLVAILVPMTVSAAAPENGWYQEDDIWYYYENGAPVTSQIKNIGGHYYAFDYDGWMYTGQVFYMDGSYHYAKENGVLASNEWVQSYGDWYYFKADTTPYQGWVQYKNIWYYFHGDGRMAANEALWDYQYERNYVFDANGGYKALTQKGWNQVNGAWYYVKDDGYVATGEMVNSNGNWYAFEHNGQMVSNGKSESWIWDPSLEDSYYVIADAKGVIVKDGWLKVGSTYYLAQNWKACQGDFYQDKGNWYYFDYDGKLVTNQDVSHWSDNLEMWVDTVAGSNGAILKDGWMQLGGYWYYATNFEKAAGDVYTINGIKYLFDYEGQLRQTAGRYGDYFIQKDGTLLTSAWYEDKAAGGWTYYGSDSRRVTGVQTVNGKLYYFNNNGVMQKNCVYTYSGAVYTFDSNGVGTKQTGWFKDPTDSTKWMYANGGSRPDGEVLTINGVKYGFDYDYRMITNDFQYDNETEAYYLFGADGRAITATGWQKADGAWYYVEAGGKLAEGWKQINGTWYNFEPYMLHDTMQYDYEYKAWYAYNASGVSTRLQGNGWRYVSWGRIYLENGKPVQNDWRQIGGYWYYFYSDGEPYNDMVGWINGHYYGFDDEGRMVTNTWMESYYFGANGKAVTGLQTIGGVKYLFDSEGWLYSEKGLVTQDGVTYFLDRGVVKATVTGGWFQVDGTWYYAYEYTDDYYSADYHLAYGDCQINGKTYLFSDYTGELLTGGLYDVWGNMYLTDGSGVIKTGWQQYKGNWYYTDSYGYLYRGWYEIDGYEYIFNNDGVLMTGTFCYDNQLITAGSGGKIEKVTALPNGWTYDAVQATYVYAQDGQPANGWVGDYYLENGRMVVNSEIQYNGYYYYLGKDGKYVRGGWYELPYGEWIYAKANGILYSNEWLQIGSNWYYFDDYQMACYESYYIDGVYHDFAANGVWQGRSEMADKNMPEKADGWQKINNKWYYYHAGKPVQGTNYINGAWYYFGESRDWYYGGEEYTDYTKCSMIASDYAGGFYYGSDGKRASYTGWKQIGGEWYYFNSDYSMASGVQKINGVWYYFYPNYYYKNGAHQPMSFAPAMQKNDAVVVNRQLYIFGADGKCYGPTTKDGWYQGGGIWYYVKNGRPVVEDYLQYNGKTYYFDYDGWMVTDYFAYNNDLNCDVYFDESGVMVTKSGWYETWRGWIYVGADGSLYKDGIYKINGKDYSFYEYILVE